jgi:hypothetical protein
MPKSQARDYYERKRQGNTPASLHDNIDLLDWERVFLDKEPVRENAKVHLQQVLDLRLFHKNFHYLLKKQGASVFYYKKWLLDLSPTNKGKHTKRPYIGVDARLLSLEYMASFIDQPVGKMLYIDYEQYGI